MVKCTGVELYGVSVLFEYAIKTKSSFSFKADILYSLARRPHSVVY